MFSLRVGIYEFVFRAEEDMLLPAAVGSMWRGVMGLQLKRMSEGMARMPRNLPAWIRSADLYAYFMTSPPPPDAPAMRRYPSVPHPYALAPQWDVREQLIRAGQEIVLRLKLFGRANELIAAVTLALARAARQGLGKGRAQARLQRVLLVMPGEKERVQLFAPGGAFVRRDVEVLRPPADVTQRVVDVEFLSPLRVQHQGRVMRCRDFSPAALLMNMVRRTAMLQLFHEGLELQADFRQLREQAQGAAMLEGRLVWVSHRRYSARQQREVPLGGIMGHARIDLSEAGDLFPFLWIGQQLQVGKGTVFGLGQYRVGRPHDA